MPWNFKSTLGATLFVLSFVFYENVAGQSLYVSAVLDAERVVLSDGARVELIGVDAIEKHGGTEQWQDGLRLGGDTESMQSKGAIAAAYLSVLVRSQNVFVSYQGGVDENTNTRYPNFKPAFLFVLDSQGRLDFLVNKRLIEDGYAFVDSQTPAAYREQFIALQNQAMESGKGLWGKRNIVVDQTGIPEVAPSGSVNFYSNCRMNEGCVWISGANQEVGYWASRQGKSCPCAK